MFFAPRFMPLRPALAGLTFLVLASLPGGCRKLLGGSEQTSMTEIESNLDQLVAPAEEGLNLQVSPRFLTFGPLPNATPWDSPVSASRTFEAHGHQLSFKSGRDGLIHERYEVRACPLREIWSCVELWATGRFGKDGKLACVGVRLEKGNTIEKRKLEMRRAENCPFRTTSSGPAQKAVRGVEKAYLDHAQQQQADKYLDPKL
jgi:hypothetical protein